MNYPKPTEDDIVDMAIIGVILVCLDYPDARKILNNIGNIIIETADELADVMAKEKENWK